MSRLFKAQKKIASMMSESKAGRNTITHFLGDTGDEVVGAFKSAAAKTNSREEAKALKTHILKLMTKVGLLVQHGDIEESAFMGAQEPALAVANAMIENLEATAAPAGAGASPPPAPAAASGSVDVAAFAALMQTLHDALLPLLQPVMKEKNWSRVTALHEFYSNAAFLTRFFHDAELADERETVRSSLRILLRPYESEIKATQVCAVNGCQLPRCALRFAQFCERHQEMDRAKRLQAPKLDDFLRNEEQMRYFTTCLDAYPGRTNALLFWLAVEDFRKTTNRSVLATRAPKLVDRFLAPGAPQLVEGLTAAVGDVGPAAAAPVRKTHFAAAQAEAYQMLTEWFRADFVGSEQWNEFCRDSALPIDIHVVHTEGEAQADQAAVLAAAGASSSALAEEALAMSDSDEGEEESK